MDVEQARYADDLELIDNCLNGDEYAIEEIVMKYQRKIYALTYKMTGNIEDSKDLTQKTFMQAFNNIKSFRKKSAFYTWLYRIALNLSLNHLKKKDRQNIELNESITAGRENPLSTIINDEQSSHLRDSIKLLPERQKTAITLRAYQGLSLKETAEVMKCSEGTIKTHYHIGMKKLREMLKEIGYEIKS